MSFIMYLVAIVVHWLAWIVLVHGASLSPKTSLHLTTSTIDPLPETPISNSHPKSPPTGLINQLASQISLLNQLFSTPIGQLNPIQQFVTQQVVSKPLMQAVADTNQSYGSFQEMFPGVNLAQLLSNYSTPNQLNISNYPQQQPPMTLGSLLPIGILGGFGSLLGPWQMIKLLMMAHNYGLLPGPFTGYQGYPPGSGMPSLDGLRPPASPPNPMSDLSPDTVGDLRELCKIVQQSQPHLQHSEPMQMMTTTKPSQSQQPTTTNNFIQNSLSAIAFALMPKPSKGRLILPFERKHVNRMEQQTYGIVDNDKIAIASVIAGPLPLKSKLAVDSRSSRRPLRRVLQEMTLHSFQAMMSTLIDDMQDGTKFFSELQCQLKSIGCALEFHHKESELGECRKRLFQCLSLNDPTTQMMTETLSTIN